ncbi:hypothetical protein Kpho02_76560 [Kitasatospora phosalacinea]|uniref:Uncharacterized protein n=1 Tax=Kitasatospora phosalacinea TaxID=2065 RepID=A0A9W6QFV8_9ACTN|nr:hypothetical protein [Kitasatospora phosalacinea]GLW75359.1 hypothetical protein Kpho02_76560 [Kitasatospora phosalacinea]
MLVTNKKLGAVCYIDDRAVTCTGNWTEAFATARHRMALTTDTAALGRVLVSTGTPPLPTSASTRTWSKRAPPTTGDVICTDQKTAAEHNAVVAALDDGSPLEPVSYAWS